MARNTLRRAGLPVLDAREGAAVAARPAAPDAPRIGLVTLGCDKNTVDSERLLARLAGAGARAVDAADADVVVINTCGFIDIAKEESVDAILDAVRLKAEGRIRAVVAMGCMVQRYKTELQAELPEVDLFLGLTEAERLVPELRARGLLGEATVPLMERPLRRLSTARRHTSHLKISEGCDHTCAFCAIPLMRGRHRSVPVDVLVEEAAQLEESGVVELNIISQDTTWYGRDLLRGAAVGPDEWFVGKSFAGMAGPAALEAGASVQSTLARPGGSGGRHGLLPELLDALLAGTTIPWLRLFYMYPSGIYPALVEQIAREPRIVPYVDMPIQHGSDAVLRRMRRPERGATIRERVGWLRDAIPDVTLRTTVIVGFPGETDEAFDEMLELLEEIRFDHLGAFAYSDEENTAAIQLDGKVNASLKRERLERVLDLQRSVSQERSERWLGREMDVLIDAVTGRDIADGAGPAGRGGVGRGAWQAPEIDGVVHVEAGLRDDAVGEFVRARVVDVIENDLKAELLDR